MTDKSISERLADARRALTCLYIAVESSVADDVKQKVEAALAEQQREIERLEQIIGDMTEDQQDLARLNGLHEAAEKENALLKEWLDTLNALNRSRDE